MDEMARDLQEQAHFLFIYTRETHPEQFPDFPSHRSIEQKLQHVQEMQERQQSPRTILIDALDGDVHRLYGGMPNMTWIIDHTGRVVYKADWTVAIDVRAALQDVLLIREFKRQRDAVYKDYFTERIAILKKGRTGTERVVRSGVPVSAD